MRALVIAAALMAAASPAFAHDGAGGGFMHGLSHPVGGLDHILAMVAVGLWAGQKGGRAVWGIPAAFMIAMVGGGVLGMVGLPLPAVETAIVASTLILGALVAGDIRLPVWAGMAVVGFMAMFHGHAHGAEMPDAAQPVLYALGFFLATGVLHGFGVVAVQVAQKALASRSTWAVRAAGVATVVSGLSLLAG